MEQSPPPPMARHVPVLLDRVLDLLAPAVGRPGAVLVDGTVGLGGHSEALLRAHPQLQLIGIDRDPQALELAGTRLAPFGDRVTLARAVYDELPRVLAEHHHPRVDGVLLDLGVSSLQLDRADRGFAYAQDAPLDMRMEPDAPRTAADVVNGYPVAELARVLRTYGEERFALRVAQAIDRERRAAPFTRTGRLAEVVRTAIPAATRRTGGHPAKRTFQALRIEVNAELAALEAVLPAAVRALSVGGRLVVLSYHSLEDRLVKRALVPLASTDVPVDMPVVPDGHEPQLRLLVRGEGPTDVEVEANPRAASVRLRAAERVREAA